VNQRYEGSWRQQRTRRRAKVVGIVLALALLIPIIVSTASAISG
jgi:hypothetical protein